MDKAVVVTGACGGIGTAIVEEFNARGYRVVGIDKYDNSNLDYSKLRYDLELLRTEDDLEELRIELAAKLKGKRLCALINNAAIQEIGPFEELSIEQFNRSLHINCTAAFGLTKALIKSLQANAGTVINIGSIHSRLTKPRFSAYAASKAALEGLTRALAVELGMGVRVCSITPAAIETEMLKAGFDYDEHRLNRLKSYHPSKTLGSPKEVSKLALILVENMMPFSNGATWNLDGGVGSRLHDPADYDDSRV